MGWAGWLCFPRQWAGAGVGGSLGRRREASLVGPPPLQESRDHGAVSVAGFPRRFGHFGEESAAGGGREAGCAPSPSRCIVSYSGVSATKFRRGSCQGNGASEYCLFIFGDLCRYAWRFIEGIVLETDPCSEEFTILAVIFLNHVQT